MSGDLRAAQEFRNKGRQMPPPSLPHWPPVPLSLSPLGSTAIRDTAKMLPLSNNTGHDLVRHSTIS